MGFVLGFLLGWLTHPLVFGKCEEDEGEEIVASYRPDMRGVLGQTMSGLFTSRRASRKV